MARVFWPGLLVALLLVSLLSCGDKEEAAPDCLDNADCEELQICQAESCVTVECLASADCPLETYCDDAANVCSAGCETTSDCTPGYACEAGVCAVEACDDTDVDCEIGELCDEETGTCDMIEGPLCVACVEDDPTSCADDFVCWHFSRTNDYYCVPPCSNVDSDECPRGATCTGLSGPTPGCMLDCPVLLEGGVL